MCACCHAFDAPPISIAGTLPPALTGSPANPERQLEGRGTACLGDDLRGGRAEQVGDELQLVHHVAAGEQGLAQQDLGEDAADGPDVDRRTATTATGTDVRPLPPPVTLLPVQ